MKIVSAIKKIQNLIQEFQKKLNEHHVSAYAAQTAYFLILSFIPFIMMLFTLIQYIPSISKSLLLEMAVELLPSSFDAMAVSIIDEVYAKSGATLSLTAIVTAWSAGKGAMAILKGLNTMNDVHDNSNYVLVRIKGAFYTVIFVITIVLALIGVVFGNRILLLIELEFPFLSDVTESIQSFKNITVLLILILLFTMMFKFMPSKKNIAKSKHLPGAVFAGVGWTVFSYAFSIYMDFSSGFSNMYGSLTTLTLVMVWLYMSMYIMFIGAEINVFFENEINYIYSKLHRKS